MKECFALARFQMAIPGGVTGVAGGMIMPSGIAIHTLQRRDLERQYPYLRRRLFDPQLYLAGLNPLRCESACAKLASYPWFGAEGIEEYDSGAVSQKDWTRRAKERVRDGWRPLPTDAAGIGRAVELCVEFQRSLGCEAIILPSPLTRDHATDYLVETEWLEAGLEISQRLAPGIPRIATVAISDTCLRGFEPQGNTLLDLILDQVAARQPEGAYVVLELANETRYYCSSPNTVGALLRLVSGFRVGGLSPVIAGFCGVAGLLALAAGADTWTTGWYRGERRLRLADFEQDEGRAMPTYFSHRLATDIHLQRDLDRLRAAGYLARVSDETPQSRGLLTALSSGRTVEDVPEWRYSPANVAAARSHYLAAAIRETNVLAGLNDADQLTHTGAWLQRAVALTRDLYTLGEFHDRTELDHQTAWQDALLRFMRG